MWKTLQDLFINTEYGNLLRRSDILRLSSVSTKMLAAFNRTKRGQRHAVNSEYNKIHQYGSSRYRETHWFRGVRDHANAGSSDLCIEIEIVDDDDKWWDYDSIADIYADSELEWRDDLWISPFGPEYDDDYCALTQREIDIEISHRRLDSRRQRRQKRHETKRMTKFRQTTLLDRMYAKRMLRGRKHDKELQTKVNILFSDFRSLVKKALNTRNPEIALDVLSTILGEI